MATFLYISISEEDKISIFELNPETGQLDHQTDVALPDPYPLVVDPGRKFLYAGSHKSNEVSSFRIDRSTGGLSLIGTAALEGSPCYLATDRRGHFLLSAYYSAGNVAVHSFADDGSVGRSPVQWLDTASGAHSIQTDPSNRFAFVPHIAGSNGPNQVFQFKFDERSGRLVPNSPFKVVPEDEAGPRHFCFHPRKDILYFSNEQGCSVTAYNLDSSAGTLTAFQTVSALGGDPIQKDYSCSQIQISPSGRFLYAPIRGHNSIACFSIEATTGRLTFIGRVPTESQPRALSLEPGGKFLFAAGEESGRLVSYRIDGDTGLPDTLGAFAIGKAPMWVLVTNLGS